MPVIDDFEDGSVSEYGPDMDIESTTVRSGTYAGHVTGSDAYSTSGLNAYPAPGDTFDVYAQLGALANYTSFAWGGPDAPNNYLVRHDGDGDLYIYEQVNDGFTAVASNTGNTYSASTSEWTHYEVEWTGAGDINVTVYDDTETQQATVSGTSTEFQSEGGFGSSAFGGNGGCYLDDCEIQGGGSATVGVTAPSAAATVPGGAAEGAATYSATPATAASEAPWAYADYESGGSDSIEFYVFATVPTDTNLRMALIEDATGDGVPDTSLEFALSDGWNLFSSTDAVFHANRDTSEYAVEMRAERLAGTANQPSIDYAEVVVPAGEGPITVSGQAVSAAATAAAASPSGFAIWDVAGDWDAAQASANTEHPSDEVTLTTDAHLGYLIGPERELD